MDAFCRLSCACCSSSYLKDLSLGLDDYLTMDEIPTISLSDLIPLPHLSTNFGALLFKDVPIKINEVKPLVNRQKHTLTSLEWLSSHLVDGSWVEVLDVLRELNNLEHSAVINPTGAEFADAASFSTSVSFNPLISEYILREIKINPLAG
jgi:hypothetical protein